MEGSHSRSKKDRVFLYGQNTMTKAGDVLPICYKKERNGY